MCRFRSPGKTTIYWMTRKEQFCIWRWNQMQGCFDILLFKENAPPGFEATNSLKQRDRVSCKAGDGFCNHHIHLNVVYDTKWKSRLRIIMPRSGLLSRAFTVPLVHPVRLWKPFFFMKISLEAWSKAATYPSLFSCRGKIKKYTEK